MSGLSAAIPVSLQPSPAAGAPAGATEPSVVVAWDSSMRSMQASNQTIDMRDDDQGYDSSYLFGMTKGVANSTMTPATHPSSTTA